MEVKEVVPDGIWTIHQRPRAIRYDDYTFVGWMDSDSSIGITKYDHTDNSATHETIGSVTDDRDDDHSSPALYIRPDERMIVFWSPRSGSQENEMIWRISDNALDISTWGPEKTFSESSDVDYYLPVEWNGDLRVYYRVGGTGSFWKYRVSTDDGDSFPDDNVVVDDSDEDYIYIHIYRHDNRLHHAVGDHRMVTPSIRHWYLEDGDYYESDGTHIQSADSAITDIMETTAVYDGTDSGNNPPKQWDLVVDSNGNPYTAFVEHVETGDDGGGDGDYRARWAGWDGTEWVVGSEIAQMGGSITHDDPGHYYSSGLGLDDQDPTITYVSVEVEDRNYQVRKYDTDDFGSTWDRTDLSAADEVDGVESGDDGSGKRGRPISPRNHQGDLVALWWAGMYDDYMDGEWRNGGGWDTVVDGAFSSVTTITAGNIARLTADISNEGDTEGDQTITLKRNGNVVDNEENVQIAASNSETVILDWATTSNDVGEHTLTVESDQDSDSVDIEVID